ncbi:unnamed protein product [Gordionus sp. m RMFG-2023]
MPSDKNTKEVKDPEITLTKEYYLNLTPNNKRKFYKCKNEYVEPKSLISWAELDLPDTNDKINSHYKIFPEINSKIYIYKGDITTLEIDCIVNAANKSLTGGGGVDGAIHLAAGPDLKSECLLLGGCEMGDAKITGGYNLPAKYVIHTVGPIGENPQKLAQCYQNCLNLMRSKNLKSIAFPCISTGVYGYPNENACQIALNTVRLWLETDRGYMDVDNVIFCLFLQIDFDAYYKYMPAYFPK